MTLVDLYRQTLEGLEVVAAGEPATPEDTQLVAKKYVLVWNQLKTHELVSWAVTEAVPDEAAQPLIDMLKFACADDFGDEPSRYAQGAIGLPQPALAERQLRAMHSRTLPASPATPEYL